MPSCPDLTGLAEKWLLAKDIPGEPMERQWVAYLPTNRKLSLAEETFLGICEIVGRDLELP